MNEQNVRYLSAKFNVDYAWLTELVKEHGEEVLVVVEDALAHGFTSGVITEILSEAGKIGLEVLLHFAKANRALGK